MEKEKVKTVKLKILTMLKGFTIAEIKEITDYVYNVAKGEENT